MNLYSENANLLMGSWLRRISDSYLLEISRVYQKLDIPFEPRWFPIFFIFSKRDKVGISELAEVIDVSQPAISQMVTTLQRKGLIKQTSSEGDGRRKELTLSVAGKHLLSRIYPVWSSIDRAVESLLKNSPGRLLTSLKYLESSVARDELYDLILSIYSSRTYDIGPLNGQMKETLFDYFKLAANVEFIYPEVDSSICIAKMGEDIVGAIAYEILSKEEFVLHNLFVLPVHRMKGIAKSLLQFAVPGDSSPCIVMYRATPELVDLLLKCPYSFKVDIKTS